MNSFRGSSAVRIIRKPFILAFCFPPQRNASGEINNLIIISFLYFRDFHNLNASSSWQRWRQFQRDFCAFVKMRQWNESTGCPEAIAQYTPIEDASTALAA